MVDKSGHLLARHLCRMGLHANPFPVTPDASNYFVSHRIEVCLAELLHCIRERKGFLLVTADVGTGKTTLSRRLIATLEQEETQVALVFNSFLHGISLLEAINQDFEISASGGIREQLESLNRYLLRQFDEEKNCVIIIDDAQNLDIESLELIRQISNLETNKAKLVQILLIAQPEILATLAYPELRQLDSRIVLRIELPSFSDVEIMDYVNYRLNCAGNGGRVKLAPGRALRLLAKKSGGYPRQINLIMDRSLYALAATKKTVVTHKVIKLAVDDLGGVRGIAGKMIWRPLFAVMVGVLMFLLTLGVWFGGEHVYSRYVASSLRCFMPQQLLATPSTLVSNSLSSKEVVAKKTVPVAASVVAVRPRTYAKDVATGVDRGETEVMERASTSLPHKQASRFLKNYNLEKFYPDFISALASNDWPGFERRIRPTGWQLLIGKWPLSANQEALYYINLDGTPHWLMLWQPDFDLGPFYFGAHSPGIMRLQQGLSDLGFYSYQIDGVAGVRTFAAVVSFQRRNGLYPSSIPDMLTLYQLSAELHKHSMVVLKN